jgi:hypothetical protein
MVTADVVYSWVYQSFIFYFMDIEFVSGNIHSSMCSNFAYNANNKFIQGFKT